MPFIDGIWYDDEPTTENPPQEVPSTPIVPIEPKPITNSILLTIKKMLGIAEEYHAFDIDIIIDINSVFLTLNQLGVGPTIPYQITGSSEVWDDFMGDNPIPGVQTYVYLKTRLLFDPPTNSFLVDAMQKQCNEFEWRMNIQVETPPIKEEPTPIIPELDNNQNGSDKEETDESVETFSLKSTKMRKSKSNRGIDLFDIFS